MYTGDRGGGFPPREDLPLPTSPPYTAFVGNMAFDLTEQDLEAFFDGLSVRSASPSPQSAYITLTLVVVT